MLDMQGVAGSIPVAPTSRFRGRRRPPIDRNHGLFRSEGAAIAAGPADGARKAPGNAAGPFSYSRRDGRARVHSLMIGNSCGGRRPGRSPAPALGSPRVCRRILVNYCLHVPHLGVVSGSRVASPWPRPMRVAAKKRGAGPTALFARLLTKSMGDLGLSTETKEQARAKDNIVEHPNNQVENFAEGFFSVRTKDTVRTYRRGAR